MLSGADPYHIVDVALDLHVGFLSITRNFNSSNMIADEIDTLRQQIALMKMSDPLVDVVVVFSNYDETVTAEIELNVFDIDVLVTSAPRSEHTFLQITYRYTFMYIHVVVRFLPNRHMEEGPENVRQIETLVKITSISKHSLNVVVQRAQGWLFGRCR